jgi:ABC-type tungstate transport system substrate-binding protein
VGRPKAETARDDLLFMARLGFDIVTTLVGSGLTLLLSAAGPLYADRLGYTVPELYAIGGAAILVVGLVSGLVLAAMGLR